MRKFLAIVSTCAVVIAIPAGCTQPKGMTSEMRISPNTHIASGRMLEAQRNYAGAANQYERAIEAQPDLTIAHHRLAELYLKLGRIDDARQTLRTAIEAGADEASLRNNLGFTLLRMERYDEAEQMFEAALAISPEFHRARMNLALLHARAGRIDDSLKQFEQLLPRADALYNIAVIRMQQRDYVTAAWGFGEAASINPNLPDARTNFEKARFLAQHSPQKLPNDDFLAALNIPPQQTEPPIVQRTVVAERPEPKTPTVTPRIPESRKSLKPRPVRPQPAPQRAIVEAPPEPKPDPVAAKATPSQPVLLMMRDISDSVRTAAAAITPVALTKVTPTVAPKPAPTITPVATATDTNTTDPSDDDCETDTMAPLQLTSAQPKVSKVAPQPMTPVTTE